MNKWTAVQRETLLRAKSTFSRAVPVDNTSEIDFRHNLNFLAKHNKLYAAFPSYFSLCLSQPYHANGVCLRKMFYS